MKCDSTHVEVMTYWNSTKLTKLKCTMIFSVRDSSQNFNGLHLGVHLCRLISNRAGINVGYIRRSPACTPMPTRSTNIKSRIT